MDARDIALLAIGAALGYYVVRHIISSRSII